MITVQPIDQTTFRVTVEGRTMTTHTVTLPPYFEFLLERESITSILRSFELPVIGRYFPEYETTITTMLAAEG